MKVALVQLNIAFEDKQKNLIRAAHFIRLAATKHADIVFFPEMTLSGFSMNVKTIGEMNRETIETMIEYARTFRIAVGFGWVRKVGEKGENHYTVVSPDGEILTDYIKIHPFSFSGEDQHYHAGSTLSLFRYCDRMISVFICYDLRFPEIFQAASIKSDVIIVAANWPQKRMHHWKSLLTARAIENQSWILGVNCYGDQNGQHYSGNSSAIRPDGTTAFEIDDAEGIYYVDIANEAVVERNSFRVKPDRKPELYSLFFRDTIESE